MKKLFYILALFVSFLGTAQQQAGPQKIIDVPVATGTPDFFVRGSDLLTKKMSWANVFSAFVTAIPPTFSGTTNRIPKFITSSTIGDSQISDNGSNVSINGATNTAKFNVKGAGATSSTKTMSLFDSANREYCYTTDSGQLFISHIGDDDALFINNVSAVAGNIINTNTLFKVDRGGNLNANNIYAGSLNSNTSVNIPNGGSLISTNNGAHYAALTGHTNFLGNQYAYWESSARMRYEGDFSAFYEPRSIPDVAYVQSLISGIGIGAYLPLSGGTMTGDLVVQTVPATPNSAVSRNFAENLFMGTGWKFQVKCSTTANHSLSGTSNVDGVTIPSGTRVLVRFQSSPEQNGIWISAAGAWTRATDADTEGELETATVSVTSGTLYGKTIWNQYLTITTINVSAVGFTNIPTAGAVTADGTYLTLVSNVFSINTTNTATVGTAQNLLNKTLTSPILVTPALGTPASGNLVNCTFPQLNQNTTGSAATLTTPRNINGVAFNGSTDITVTAAAGTLSGATLNSSITGSSLTATGTIGTGVWNATAIGSTYGGTGINTSASTGIPQIVSGTWSVSTALLNGTTATTQSANNNSTSVATTAYSDTATALKQDKSIAAYSVMANNTASTANATSFTFKAPGQQTYAGTITWAGTTAPSGATTHTYNWQQVGNLVTLQVVLSYATAGTAVSSVKLSIPGDCPTPLKPTGLGDEADEVFGTGYGKMNTGPGSFAATGQSVFLKMRADNMAPEIYVFGTSLSYKSVVVVVTYFTN